MNGHLAEIYITKQEDRIFDRVVKEIQKELKSASEAKRIVVLAYKILVINGFDPNKWFEEHPHYLDQNLLSSKKKFNKWTALENLHRGSRKQIRDLDISKYL